MMEHGVYGVVQHGVRVTEGGLSGDIGRGISRREGPADVDRVDQFQRITAPLGLCGCPVSRLPDLRRIVDADRHNARGPVVTDHVQALLTRVQA